jgi:SAM-dependent methyltransferase
MNDHREMTRVAYDAHAAAFDESFGNRVAPLIPKLDAFIAALPPRTLVLDLGSGPGFHALYMRSKGCDVLCLDYSPEMVRLCKEKGLDAEVGDMENLCFAPGTFGGVWASASLLHAKKKSVPRIIGDIANMLIYGGAFGLGLIEGTTEGFVDNGPGDRWFSHFTDAEVRSICDPYFRIIEGPDAPAASGPVFLNYLMKKHST